MNTRNRLLVLISAMLPWVAIQCANANGINPPRPATTVVTAICADGSGKQLHKIMRAQVKDRAGSTSTQTVTFRSNDANEQLSIANIKTVALTSKAIDKDGFTSATLTRRHGSSNESGAVRVKSANTNLKLVGFTSAGTRVEVDLFNCKRVEFSSAADDGHRNPPQNSAIPLS